MNELAFEVVFHLAGAQVIPNYMGIAACTCPLHMIVVTDRTEKLRERLQKVLGLAEKAIPSLPVPAYDYPEIMRRLNERVAEFEGRRIGFNITGGTKPMFAAALDVCRAKGITPFYIDTETRKIHWFAPPYDVQVLPGFFRETSPFIALAGENIGARGRTWAETGNMARRRLIADFWKHRDGVRIAIRDFAEASHNRFRGLARPPDVYWAGYDQLMGWASRKCPMLAEHWAAVFPDEGSWPAAAEFGRGGWFEEYVLLTLQDVDGMRDVRMGMTVSVLDADRNEKTLQELDISYTNGYELVMIECKAGGVAQEHVQKLENLSQRLGGSFGRGVLVALNAPDDVVRARISNSRLSMICGAACSQLPERLRNMRPGQVCEG